MPNFDRRWRGLLGYLLYIALLVAGEYRAHAVGTVAAGEAPLVSVVEAREIQVKSEDREEGAGKPPGPLLIFRPFMTQCAGVRMRRGRGRLRQGGSRASIMRGNRGYPCL